MALVWTEIGEGHHLAPQSGPLLSIPHTLYALQRCVSCFTQASTSTVMGGNGPSTPRPTPILGLYNDINNVPGGSVVGLLSGLTSGLESGGQGWSVWFESKTCQRPGHKSEDFVCLDWGRSREL